MKHIKRFNESFNESIALDYLKDLYHIGGISSDAYDLVKHEDEDYLISFDKLGDISKIKKEVLNHLSDVGAISTDVYELEMENISESNFIKEEFDRDGYETHWVKFKTFIEENGVDVSNKESDLYSKFMEIVNDDNLSSEEKSDKVCFWLSENIGLDHNYNYIWEYLESLLMDEI